MKSPLPLLLRTAVLACATFAIRPAHSAPLAPPSGATAVAPGRPQHLTSPDQVPDGLAKSDWQNIRAAYEAGRHSFQPTANGWRARNPGQQWITTFDRRGFLAEPQGGGWSWGLELQSYGFGKNQHVIGGTPAMQASGTRLAYQWDATVQEWFVNDQRGLEHGFTLRERPAAGGSTHDDSLSLTIAARGTLRPVVSADTLGVLFQDAAGSTVVNYTGLKVWDADGRALPSRFESAGENSVRLLIDEHGARYPLTIDPIAQQAYVKASNTEANDTFGASVAIAGDTVIVGAYNESSNANTVNGNQADNSAGSSGAAYVFTRTGTTWSQQAYLKASNAEAVDVFGYSVAIAGDTVVVGAYGEDSGNGLQGDNSAGSSGAAYVFTRTGTTWSQQAYLKASNPGVGDRFGTSVAISSDTVVVGANQESSNATGVNGNQADNSAGSSGAAYVFTRTGTTWSQQAYLKASNTGASDQFGKSVAIAGDTIVVGAAVEASNATGVNGNQADNSASNSGAAYVFTRTGTTWSQQAYLKASNTGASDQFGTSVAIAGDTIIIGALGEDSNATGVNGNQADNSAGSSGAAYVFTRTGTTWSQQAYLKASNAGASDQFGESVAISSDTIVVGATLEASNATGVNGNQADNSANFSGAAYVFTRAGTAWSQQAYLKASNAGISDQFGISVAISSDTVVVGAYTEDSNATGVNGNEADNSASQAGAVYIFTGFGNAPTVTTPTSASVTGTTATLGGNVTSDGGLAVTARGVVYSLTSSNATPQLGGTGVTNATTTGTTGVFTVPVTGLTAGSGYSFAAYATNSSGTSYSSVGTFTTLSTNANLSALALSAGTLSPAFASGTTSYTATVASNITVTPTVADATATVTVNGTTVASGSASGALTMATGANTVTVVVTAQDGTTTNTYTITVTRSADFTVTTTSGALVVTNNLRTAQTLALSESSGNLVLTNSGGAFLTNGTGSTGSASVAVSGLTSIVINGGTGNDTINVGAFTAALPSVTINGGAGDDTINFNGNVTFSAGSSLDVDLQNDTATPGTDIVNLAAGAHLITSGTGTITIKVSKNVVLNTGSSLETVNGGITVEANQQATATAGTFYGVSLTSSIIASSGTGQVIVKGRGGDAGSGQVGILLQGVCRISGGTTGTATVVGAGGPSTSGSDYGVIATSTGSQITSLGSDVSVTGTGGGAGAANSNAGVAMLAGSTITSGGNGSVSVTGTGGAGTSSNTGVVVQGGTITAGGSGTVAVTGTGGGSASGTFNQGVEVTSAGTITSGGGAITVTGTGGSGTNNNRGVRIDGTGSLVTSSNRDISITGQGGAAATGLSNPGILVTGGGRITSTGTGATAAKIILTGVGGGGTGLNFGVDLEGTTGPVTSVDGDVRITGTPGSDGIAGGTYGITIGYPGNTPTETLSTSGAGNIELISDTIRVTTTTGIVNAGANTVTLRPKTPGRTLTIGGTDSDSLLNLTDAVLDRITAGTLVLGDSVSGAMTVSSAITRLASTALSLNSASSIVLNASIDSGGGSIALGAPSVTAAGTGTDLSMNTSAFSFGSGSSLALAFTTATADTGYNQLKVTGAVNLAGAALSLSGSYVPTGLDVFTLLDNDGTDAVTGTFTGLAEGATINNVLGSGRSGTISYVGGTGNDVVLTMQRTAIPVVLGSLNQTYNGTAGAVSVTTVPSGLSVSLTYAGSTTPPTNPGSYAVVATINDDNYSGTATGTLVIAKISQAITFDALPDLTSTDAGPTLTATASSGLPVTYTVSVGSPVLLAGSTVNLIGVAGTVGITASQAGDDTYSAAPDVTRSFNVTAASASIFFGQTTGPNSASGDCAAMVAGTGGTLMIAVPAAGVNLVADFQFQSDGTFVSTVTIPAVGGAGPTTVTIQGRILNGVISGTIPELGLNFSLSLIPQTGVTAALAGYNRCSLLDSGTGNVSTIIGAQGQILVVASTPTLVTGGLGTIAADGTYNVVVSGAIIAGTFDVATTISRGTFTATGQAALAFAGLRSTTTRTDRLINLSARAQVGSGSNVLIIGFVIAGAEPKPVLIRGVGPRLTAFGLQGVLANPALRIFSGSTQIAENDDWGNATSAGNLVATTTGVGAFALANDSADASVLVTLAPGAYTAQVFGNGGTGVALAEVYDASSNPNAQYQRLTNISTRGDVGPGENILINGFSITGNSPKKILIRGVGPGLTPFGVAGVLADPHLRVFRDSTLVAENDNWSAVATEAAANTEAAGLTGAFALTSGSRDSVLLLTLAPGAYTAQVGTADNLGTGLALVEIYEVPQ